MTKTETGAGNRPQTIHRTAHDKDHPYTCVSNKLAEDNTLSLEARGLMLYILSKPDDWQINIADLSRAGNNGESKTRRILKELINAGYIKKTVIRDHGKYAKHRYTIHESPLCENPQVDKPQVEKPVVENRTQVSNQSKQVIKETSNHQQNNNQSSSSYIPTTIDTPQPKTIDDDDLEINEDIESLFVGKFGRPPVLIEKQVLTMCTDLKTWQAIFKRITSKINSPADYLETCLHTELTRTPKLMQPDFNRPDPFLSNALS